MKPDELAKCLGDTIKASLEGVEQPVRATIYLKRENGKADIVIGIPESGRERSDFDKLIKSYMDQVSGIN